MLVILTCLNQFTTYSFVIAWVAGNEAIVKNVNANIPVSLSWFLLPLLAFLCFLASARPIYSSLQWPNYRTANEGSLAFAEKLNKAIANLNQWVKLRPGSRGKPRKAEETTIKTQVCLRLHL